MKDYKKWGIKLRNLKKESWDRNNSNFLYIGRKNSWMGLEESPFHNPFVLKSEYDRDKILCQYRDYVFSSKEIIESLPSLINKELWCYCSPKTCHGEVLLEALEKFYPHMKIMNWELIKNKMKKSTLLNLLEDVKSDVKWNYDAIMPDGNSTTLPRLMSYVSENGEDYSYSNLTIKGCEWGFITSKIKEMIEKETGYEFNSCLLNWYRDGSDKIGWHADKEKQLGENPVIVTFNLGDSRTFHFRRKEDRSIKYEYVLEAGDILIMDRDCQKFWEHAILPEPNKGERISLTFRLTES
jgi:alkylated DNA repair dioxygenase AlkB